MMILQFCIFFTPQQRQITRTTDKIKSSQQWSITMVKVPRETDQIEICAGQKNIFPRRFLLWTGKPFSPYACISCGWHLWIGDFSQVAAVHNWRCVFFDVWSLRLLNTLISGARLPWCQVSISDRYHSVVIWLVFAIFRLSTMLTPLPGNFTPFFVEVSGTVGTFGLHWCNDILANCFFKNRTSDYFIRKLFIHSQFCA